MEIAAEQSIEEADLGFDLDDRLDSAIYNAVLGIGGALDKVSKSSVNTAATKPLSLADKAALYATDAFCRAVCEVIPQKAVRGGWEITFGGDVEDSSEILTALGAYESRVASGSFGSAASTFDTEDDLLNSVSDCFFLAQVWANVMDGAVIVLNIDDGQPMNKPVNTARIKTIRAADVLDRNQIRPVVESNWNPLRPNYYELVSQEVLDRDRFQGMANQAGVQAYSIHRSRIIRFDGLITTQEQMKLNEGWGGSPLDLLWSELNRWRCTQDAIANAVMDHSLFVRKLKGLRDSLASKGQKGEAALQANSKAMKMMASIMGGVTIDMEKESLEYLQRQFSGIPDLVREFRDSLIGASRHPHTLLFGESPSGLGASGESEENSIANLVSEFQATAWRKKLLRVYRLIFLAKDGPTKGVLPDGWDLRFRSLIPESEADKASSRSTQAQTDNVYITAGVLDKEEVRQSRFGRSEYSFETQLDEKLWKKKQEEANQDPFADYGSLLGESEPASPSEEQVQQDSIIPFLFPDSRYASYWRTKAQK